MWSFKNVLFFFFGILLTSPALNKLQTLEGNIRFQLFISLHSNSSNLPKFFVLEVKICQEIVYFFHNGPAKKIEQITQNIRLKLQV